MVGQSAVGVYAWTGSHSSDADSRRVKKKVYEVSIYDVPQPAGVINTSNLVYWLDAGKQLYPSCVQVTVHLVGSVADLAVVFLLDYIGLQCM